MKILGAAMLITPFVVMFAVMWRETPPSRETLQGIGAAILLAAWIGVGAYLLDP